MLRYFYLLLLVASWIALITVSHAAILLEGTVTQQIFPRQGSTFHEAEIVESFKVIADGNRWRVETHLLSHPEVRFLTPAFPLEQVAGSDGSEIFYVKKVGSVTNFANIALVMPGNPPRMGDSASVSFLWLACCAGGVLTNELLTKMPSPWAEFYLTGGPQTNLLDDVKFERGDFAGSCLKRIDFLKHGDVPKSAANSPNAPPKWVFDYTKATYRVVESSQKGDGPKFPTRFELESYSPVWSSGVKRLQYWTTMMMSAVVTNSATTPNPESWRPELPEGKVTVQDYRPVSKYGAVKPDEFTATNGWPKQGF